MTEAAATTPTDPAAEPLADYGYIAGRVLVYGGLVVVGFGAAWMTMRLLNRTHLASLTDVEYLPASTVSQYGVIQEKRDFYIGASLPKGLGGQVKTVDTADGLGWVAVDDVFNYKTTTDAKGNVTPARGPLYDSRCEKGGVYGCNSRNPADDNYSCRSRPGDTWIGGSIDDVNEYCARIWENNNAWWAVYNSVYSDTAGMVCKTDGGAYVDCKTKLPYGEQAVKCFQDVEYQRQNEAYCAQFRESYCAGVIDQIGCVYAAELPSPNEVDWEQAGLTVIRIGTNGYHWPDNRGKDTVRVLMSPTIDGVQPNLPVCPDPNDARCQTGNELVPIRTAARFAGSSNTLLGYGYYSGNTNALGSPDVPNGQFTNSFPQKSQCAGSKCYPKTPTAKTQPDVWQNSRTTFYNTKSTLRSGGQA